MYFVISNDGFSGYGETISKAIKDLEEQDSGNSLESLVFYKAQKIEVALVEKPVLVEVNKAANKPTSAKSKR